MAYVTSTNLCYHDNMHVECSLVVDRFRGHLQYRLFQSPKYSTDGYGSLHSSVTSQPKTIGHFTAYPKQIEFDFGHSTAYYLLVGVCCPRGFDLCCEFDFIYLLVDLIKNCDVV